MGKLTDSTVRALQVPPSGNRITYEGNGFGVRITAAGARAFVLNYRVDGRERRITIGSYPAWSVAAARTQAAKLRQQADLGKDPLLERQRRRGADTVFELAERYINEHAKAHKRSWKEDQRRLNKHVLPVWSARKVEDVTRRDVDALVSRIARDTPIEANRVLALVRKMFSFALDKAIVEAHPCLRMRAPGKETARDRALQTPADLQLLWQITGGGEWADTMPAREAAALRLLVLTGARVSEIASMPTLELDLIANEWHLPAARNKGKRDHLVPLVEEAVVIVEAQPRQGRYLFQGSRGGALNKKAVERALRATLAKAKTQGYEVVEFTPHDLRRTVETGMAAAGVPKEYRDRVLNHKDASVGGINYNKHDYLQQKREALTAWAARLQGLLGNKESNVVALHRGHG